MTIPLTQESKNTVGLTLPAKPNLTWDEATMDWNDADGTWDNPGTPLQAEAKNTVALTSQTKT